MSLKKKVLEIFNNDNSFKANVTMLISSTAFGQFLLIASSPLLTRIYTPDDFGILTAFLSIVVLMSVVSTFSYVLAIPLPKDDEEAFNLLALAVLILCIFLTFYSVTLIVFDDYFSEVISENYYNFLWASPVAILAISLYQILSYWAIRKNSFGELSKTKITQSFTTTILQILLGLFKLGPAGMIIGDVGGRFAGIKSLYDKNLKKDLYLYEKITFKSLIATANKFKKFPIYTTPSAFLNSIGAHLMPVFLLIVYGPIVAGLFALGERVIGMPMKLIGNSISQAYVSSCAKSVQNKKPIMGMFMKIFTRLLFIAVLLMGLVAVFGPWIFSLVFGEAWGEAGIYARILSVMFVLRLSIVPLAQTLNVLEKQKYQFYWDLSRVFLLVIAFLYVWLIKTDPITTILIYSLLMSFLYVVMIATNIMAIRKYEKYMLSI